MLAIWDALEKFFCDVPTFGSVIFRSLLVGGLGWLFLLFCAASQFEQMGRVVMFVLFPLAILVPYWFSYRYRAQRKS